MTTFSTIRIPPPISWEEFQIISKDALAIRWRSSDLQHNGRQGQKQSGVDIWGSDDLGRKVGVECKNYSQQIKLSLIKKGILAAEKFKPKLAAYFFVTSTPRDADLQKKVRLISEERVKNKKFPIGIYFWDDISGDLASDEEIFLNHYPQLRPSVKVETGGSRLLAALQLGYLGMFIEEYIELVFGEIGFFANEKPEQIYRLTSVIKTSLKILFYDEDEVRKIVQLCEKLEDACIETAYGRIDSELGWQDVNRTIEIISAKLEGLSGSLSGENLGVFVLGKKLGTWHLIKLPRGKSITALDAEAINRGLAIAILDQKKLSKVVKFVKSQIGITTDDDLEQKAAGNVFSDAIRGINDQEIKLKKIKSNKTKKKKL